MKIALCLSGHLRNFERTYPALYFYFLKDHDVDIFIHTWDKLGFSCAFKTDMVLNDTESKISEVNRLYKPKKMIVESSSFVNELIQQGNEYAPHLRNVPKHVGHMAGMFYKIYACNEIRKRYQLETGVKYDWVIRCRPDLLFQNNVTIPQDKKPGKIWMPRALSNPDWYNDQFAAGSPDDMDLYSSVFFDIPEYFRAKMEYYPEKFMVWALKKKNLTAEWWNVYFSIYR
jgi:hypothetical protein